jgi:hypothetical protein
VRQLWWSRGGNWAGHVARIQNVSEYIHNFILQNRKRKTSVMIVSRRGREDNATSETDLCGL